MGYSVDTCVIIDIHKNHYPKDIFPALWQSFEGLIKEGSILFTMEVLNELKAKDDDCYDWANSFKYAFVDEAEYWQEAQSIGAANPGIVKPNKQDNADPFVIALAKSRNLIVVSSEGEGAGKIHRACQSCGVRSMNFVGFLREQKLRFDINSPKEP